MKNNSDRQAFKNILDHLPVETPTSDFETAIFNKIQGLSQKKQVDHEFNGNTLVFILSHHKKMMFITLTLVATLILGHHLYQKHEIDELSQLDVISVSSLSTL